MLNFFSPTLPLARSELSALVIDPQFLGSSSSSKPVSWLSDVCWALLFISEVSTYKHGVMWYTGTSSLLPLLLRSPTLEGIGFGMYQHFLTVVLVEKNPILSYHPHSSREKDQIWSMRYSTPHNKMRSFKYKMLVVTDAAHKLWRQSIVLGLFPSLFFASNNSTIDFRCALPAFTFILEKCSGKRKVILLDNRQNHLK